MWGGEDTGALWRRKERLEPVAFPAVMGILNATPDSFHAGSRVGTDGTAMDEALRRTETMLDAGATFIDVGGMSTRPGSEEVTEEEELRRVVPVVEALHRRFPEAWISIDTYRARVADEAVQAGASMVNDIGAGLLDPAMLQVVAKLAVPYVAMHMQGRPRNMQVAPSYGDVLAEVTHFLSERRAAAHAAGIPDVVLDPGFGFGKTTAHNHALLHGLEHLCLLGAPLLVGVSRKRMINEVLGTTAAEALNGTTVLNTVALMKGAAILRVHDVREAVEAVRLLTWKGC